MHITTETAALVAQVYPALLIAILLEGKLTGVNIAQLRWFALSAYYLRLIAAVGAVTATFGCLIVVASGNTSITTDWLVTIAGAALFLYLAIMAGFIMGRDQPEVWSLFSKRGHLRAPASTPEGVDA